MSILGQVPVKAVVNITGGGMRNISRPLPAYLDFVLESWDVPQEFQVVQKYGKISEKEMYNTFNMGVGMVVVVDKEVSKVLDLITVGHVKCKMTGV